MKKLLILVLILCSFCLIACQDSSQKTLNSIKETSLKIQNYVSSINSEYDGFNNNFVKGTISKHQIVDYKNNEKDINEGTGYDGATFTSLYANDIDINNMPNKFAQISQEAYYYDNNVKTLYSYINLKSNNIINLCEKYDEENIVFDKDINNKLLDICSKLLLSLNQLELKKDDIILTNEKVVKNYQESDTMSDSFYNAMCDYVACLQNENRHLNNINYNLDELDFIFNENLKQSNNTKKTWSNIDTYKNANLPNKKVNNNKSQKDYNSYPANPYYNYGQGTSNPFYRNGMNNPYFRNPYWGGNYGYGYYSGGFGYSPYSNYNPYMPNIDTFGSYSNVDTYMTIPENNDNQLSDDCETNFTCPYCHKKICISNAENKVNNEVENEKINVTKPNVPPKIERL